MKTQTTTTERLREPLALEMQGSRFGDRRIDQRSVEILESLGRNPAASINSAMIGRAATAGAYRFFSNPMVTPERILSGHRQQSILRAAQYSSIRLVQDTSETDFSSLSTLRGSGPLADAKHRGAFLHTSLMVAPGGLALGVYDNEFLVRSDEDLGNAAARKQLPIEDKESFRWLAGFAKACDLQTALPDSEVISVADREADIYEIFADYAQRLERGEKPAQFVIRAKEDRVLLGEHEGKTLFDLDGEGAALGTHEFEVPAQLQRYKEKGSTCTYQRRKRPVKQEIRVHVIRPRPPARKGRKLPQVTLYLVCATEIDVPEDQRPINWRLLTSKAVGTLEEAVEIIDIYRDRWQIEVFFRTLKSGCRIERLGLKEMKGLERGMTMLSVVAWRQMYVTHLARHQPDLPCGRVFERHEWEGTLRVIDPGARKYEEPRLGDFILKVASLGGYLNRKHDPAPGPQVLWCGMQKVLAYGEAWQAFTRLHSQLN